MPATAVAGVSTVHVSELVSLFGNRQLLPLSAGGALPLNMLAQVLVLPQAYVDRSLGDADGTRVSSVLEAVKMPLLRTDFVRRSAPPPAPPSAPPGTREPTGFFCADATDHVSLAGSLIDKLSRAHGRGALDWVAITPAGARALVAAFATAQASGGDDNLDDIDDAPTELLHPGRREALCALPIFESLAPRLQAAATPTLAADASASAAGLDRAAADGELVSLQATRYLLADGHPFFTPNAQQAKLFLKPNVPSDTIEMLELLGVKRLRDADVFATFLLPAFSSLSTSEQVAQRTHLLKEWPTLRQHDGFVGILRDTPFVPVGDRLLRARDVLDPRVDVLSYIFGGEAVFPEAECCTEEWLAVLAFLGMKTSIDRASFLDCARKVEQLAGGPALGEARADGPPSPDVLSRASLLAHHLIEHFGALTESDDESDIYHATEFCTALSRVRFVPSHEPARGVAPHEGEATLACFAELALHQDRLLVWTAAPLLQRDLTPPRSHWAELGVLHPPPAETVLAHALALAQSPPDVASYAGTGPEKDDVSVENVFGAIWAHVGERWHTFSPEARAKLTTAPLLLCGSAFVRPSRVYTSVFGTCRPLLQPVDAISSTPKPSDAILHSIGVRPEPSLSDLLRVLKELPTEYSGVRLTPAERRALIALLQQACEFSAFRADGALAVPTDDGHAVSAATCVLNDAPWMLRRMRPGVVHLASDALDPPLRAKMQLRKLSDVVIERLAPGFEPRIEGTTDDLSATELTSRIRSMDFAAVASTLLGAHAGWRDASLTAPPRTLRTDAITNALRPYTVTIVTRLQTRLVLASDGSDVTRDDIGGGDEPWHVERMSSEILVLATLPDGLSHELVVSHAVCEILGCDAPPSLAPLLAAPPSRALATLDRLRHQPPPQWAVARASGAPGTPCSAEDEAMLQLVPMRPYFAGEVVAVDALNLGGGSDDGGRVYAEVDVPPPPSGRRDHIALRVGSGRALLQCLPLHVHSFRSQRKAAEAEDADAANVPASQASNDAATTGGASATNGVGGSGGSAPSGPSPAELVDAVSSVLRRAGVPIGLETAKLLDANLALQAELSTYKLELEERTIEAGKAKRELESTKRGVTCQICMERKVEIALNACGHMLCAQCVGRIDSCPFCRRELVTGTTRLRW